MPGKAVAVPCVGRVCPNSFSFDCNRSQTRPRLKSTRTRIHWFINEYSCFQKFCVHFRGKIGYTENRSSILYLYLAGVILNIKNNIRKKTFCRIQKYNFQIFSIFSIPDLCPVLGWLPSFSNNSSSFNEFIVKMLTAVTRSLSKWTEPILHGSLKMPINFSKLVIVSAIITHNGIFIHTL